MVEQGHGNMVTSVNEKERENEIEGQLDSLIVHFSTPKQHCVRAHSVFNSFLHHMIH